MHADDEQMNDDDPMVRAAASADPAVGLGVVRALRTLADRLEDVHVASARSQGWSWQAIAEVLQVSRQAVHQKHSYREAAEAAGKDGNDV
ncbi:helix-turn-helix domain-containing protein [Gordonia sp. (in: high G+C Gram-positive bacteria)]|uniref:helix-turn-helix domain-containing protein n=1 Tax=Gordonia sp. (in: high G+C Gram-positive bacteria) TaxID=84139 RepID=UPI0016B74023|nr:helix-turn-helix domain-containing protein [Gordonia sp. (in: high G+C Gram-positive bacteria)]NLG45524.1 helix-turn-helix domain-containing protein [Gordonia sp. (in: high G+C Gram-positive bacteria)]